MCYHSSESKTTNPLHVTHAGLTDEMRSDFSLMKDLAVHTRVDPKTRNDSLLTFMGDICR